MPLCTRLATLPCDGFATLPCDGFAPLRALPRYRLAPFGALTRNGLAPLHALLAALTCNRLMPLRTWLDALLRNRIGAILALFALASHAVAGLGTLPVRGFGSGAELNRPTRFGTIGVADTRFARGTLVVHDARMRLPDVVASIASRLPAIPDRVGDLDSVKFDLEAKATRLPLGAEGVVFLQVVGPVGSHV